MRLSRLSNRQLRRLIRNAEVRFGFDSNLDVLDYYTGLIADFQSPNRRILERWEKSFQPARLNNLPKEQVQQLSARVQKAIKLGWETQRAFTDCELWVEKMRNEYIKANRTK